MLYIAIACDCNDNNDQSHHLTLTRQALGITPRQAVYGVAQSW